MRSSADLIRLGYWPSRQLSGEIPPAIRSPEEYSGADVLNIACTQTGLSTRQERRLIDQWIRYLPTVSATTLVFSSKVSQGLFDAACAVPNLRALSVKWSSCQSLAQLKRAEALEAFFLGSSPSISDLSPISALSRLKYLFIENVASPVDLSFVEAITDLREFGLSASRGSRLQVLTLAPLASRERLEMLWLVSVNIMQDGLRPLHRLRELKSLRTTIKPTSAEFKELCAALPSLVHFQAVG